MPFSRLYSTPSQLSLRNFRLTFFKFLAWHGSSTGLACGMLIMILVLRPEYGHLGFALLAISQLVGIYAFFKIGFGERLNGIYETKERVNRLIPFIYMYLPITAVPYLAFFLFAKARPDGKIPFIFRNLGAPVMCVACWISFLALLIQFQLASRSVLRAISYFNSPVIQYASSVHEDSKWVFDLNDRLKKSSFSPIKEIEATFSSRSFDSTGHILLIAVLASDNFRRRKGPEGKVRLLEDILWIERLRSTGLQIPYSFSPIALISPLTMIELSFLIPVELDVLGKYEKAMGNKIHQLVPVVKKAVYKSGDQNLIARFEEVRKLSETFLQRK